MERLNKYSLVIALVIWLFLLSACNNSGGGDESSSKAATLSIRVSNLSGSLQLLSETVSQLSSGETTVTKLLDITKNGDYLIDVPLSSGSQYRVDITPDSSVQNCALLNREGIIVGNSALVQVDCSDSTVVVINNEVGNQAPSVSNVQINPVDNLLTGSSLQVTYTYADKEGNAEANTFFRWYLDGQSIPGATGTSYTIQLGDLKQQLMGRLSVSITPVAGTGTTLGKPVFSNSVVAYNSAAILSNVSIQGSTNVGNTLTVDYIDGDADGDIVVTNFQWYRGETPISGATHQGYSVQLSDIGQAITVHVTTAALGGNTSATTINSNPVNIPGLMVNVSAGLKQLNFSWNSIPGASYYKLKFNPGDSSDFSQVATNIVGLSYTQDIAVHRMDWAKATYVVEACDNTNCGASDATGVLDAMLGSIGYIKASNTGTNYNFGTSVVLSADGNTLAVGAPMEASNATGVNCNGNAADTNFNGIPDCQEDVSMDKSGAVYVFSRVNNSWAQQAYIKASNTGANDEFGWSVALSSDGHILVVGAPQESSKTTGVNCSGDTTDANSNNIPDCQEDDSILASGAVYIFTLANNSWSQYSYVKPNITDMYDIFGEFVSLSADGNTLSVSASGDDSNATGVNCNGDTTDANSNNIPDCQEDNSVSQSGAVYVFSRDNNSWTQQSYVKPSKTMKSGDFGSAMALSANGDTLAVGAYFEGSMYVFTRGNNNWSQQSTFKASNSNTGGFMSFGYSAALSSDGNTLAVGANQEKSNATGVNCNGDATDANNNNIPDCQEDTSANYSGAVYVFNRFNNNWSQQAYIKASNTDYSDLFGNSVALSADGNTLAIGAYSESSTANGINCFNNSADANVNGIPDCQEINSVLGNAGAAYLFTRSAGSWSQKAYIKASNPSEKDDYFGIHLSLSANGNTLAIAALQEGSNATGVNCAGNTTDNNNNMIPDCQEDESMGGSGAVYFY